MVSAISDRLSSEKPQNHMMPNVATSETGSATPAMMVARMVRRNSSTTSTTSPTLSTSVNCTSCTEARMVPVRSCTTVSVASLGMARCRRGNSVLTRLTVSMTLAPGWRCTSMMTAEVSWYQPPTLAFSRLSMTSATSFTSTGAPLR